jgi:hypothetical protein
MSKRLQSIGDARIAIEEYLEHPEGAAPPAARSAPPPPRRLSLLPWVLFALAAIAAVVLAIQSRRAPDAPAVKRFSVEIGDSPMYESMSALDISRDGGRFAVIQTISGGAPVDGAGDGSDHRNVVIGDGNSVQPVFFAQR